MSDAWPRVLILSDEGPQTGTAGGLLLHRLFRGCPAGRLRVLARHVPTIGDGLPGVTCRKLLPPWHRFEGSRFHRLKRSLRAWGLVPPAPLAALDALLEGFAPEVVFCVMQHAQYYDTAHRFAAARGLPLVVAVHDVNDEFEPVYGWAREAARRRDGAFYRFAVVRLCISPEMERLCAARFGADGSVLYPNRSEELAPRPLADAGTLRSPGRLTVGFGGNLNYGYGEALSLLLPAIRGAGVRLVLYGRAPGPELAALAAATDCCEFRGFVPSAAAWAGIQRDCDAVWLPYPNPAGSMERLYRHHFPSKLPEYLALGMPVIVTGPDYATGVRWARANAAAVVVASGADQAEMTALFQTLATDHAARRQLAERGWAAGQRDFDPAAICAQFLAHLNAAVRR
ncbi:MAG: glycosyltransferase [Lacunisphaera sp.]|nr:glycosyltransferase [Lacunisphaera sp.]